MASEERKCMRFMCFWSREAFSIEGKDEVALNDQSFFTEDLGYTAQDRSDIGRLAIGDSWMSRDYGDFHIVTRVE